MDEEINSFLNNLEKNASRIVKKFSLSEIEDQDEPQYREEQGHDLNLVDETMDIIGEKLEKENRIPSHVDIEKYIDLVLDRSVDDQISTRQSFSDVSGSNISMSKSFRKNRKDGGSPLWKKKLRSSIIDNVLRRSPTKKKSRQEVQELPVTHNPTEKERREEERILVSLVNQEPKDPIDQILYYLKIISSFPNRDFIRIEAVKRIRGIWMDQHQSNEVHSLSDHSETISNELIQHAFKNYQNQTEEMNKIVIETVCQIRVDELTPQLPSLIHLMKIPSQFGLKRTILNGLFKMSFRTIFNALLKECAQPSSEWDSLILTILSNHPFSIQHVIVPALIRECESKSMTRRLQAVRAIYDLGPWAKNTLPKLCDMYENGELDRRILGTTIRRLGPEGEQTLLYCLNSNWNTRIRSCSAYALGEDIDIKNERRIPEDDEFEIDEDELGLPRNDLCVLVHAGTDIGIYFSKRRSVLKYCDEGFLIFDARELIVQLKRHLDLMDRKFADEKKMKQMEKEAKLEDGEEEEEGLKVEEEEDAEEDLFYIPYSCPSFIDDYIGSLLDHCSNGVNPLDTFHMEKKDKPPPKQLKKPRKVLRFTSKHYCNRFYRSRFQPEYHNEKEVLNALNEAIEDPEEKVRLEVAKSVGVASHPSSLPSLLKAVAKESSIVVKGEMLGSLSYLQSVVNSARLIRRTIRVLTQLLDDKMYNVRYMTCRTIRAWGENFKTLLSSHNSENSEMFLDQPQQHRDPSSSTTTRKHDRKLFNTCLQQILKCFKDGTINRNCCSRTLVAMGRLGISQLCIILSKETSFHSKLRMSSAAGLQYLDVERCGGQEVIDQVVETLFSSSSDRIPNVRGDVLTTMLVMSKKAAHQPYLQNTSLLPFFYSFLKDKSDSVRTIASRCLAEMGEQGEMVLMESLLKDPSELVRISSATGCSYLWTVRDFQGSTEDNDDEGEGEEEDGVGNMPENHVFGNLFDTCCTSLRKERSSVVRKEIVKGMKGNWKGIVEWMFLQQSKEFVKGMIEKIKRVLEIHQMEFLFFLKRKIVERV